MASEEREMNFESANLGPTALAAKGWVYRDFPQMLPDYWKEILSIIGSDNCVKLTEATYKRRATYKRPGGTYMRGQLMISPAGMENLRRRAEQPPSRDGVGK